MEESYIDIHMHLIPKVDDGAQSMEESMQMLHVAFNEGICTIIATPHYGMEQYSPDTRECERLVQSLNERISNTEELKGMKVLLGNELLYRADISNDIKQGKVNTLAGTNYVLTEFYVDAPFSTLEACAKEMKLAGYKPIFAHVERYFCLMDDISKLDRLKELDALLQVNSFELKEPPQNEHTRIGLFKRLRVDLEERRRKLAWNYVLSGKIDLIASDAHGTDWRPPIMKTSLENIRAVGGNELADKLIENAENILK